MKNIWLITYNLLFLPVFWLIAKILSLFNQKIKSGFRGRRELFSHLEVKIQTLDSSRRNILIHCSSLGEFEQAKPIIDELDKTNKYNFIVSFFSPSGFNHSKLDSALNSRIIKTYIPFDTPKNSNRFIDIINPSAVLFIKYDLWFNFLNILNKRNIFTALVNAVYDEKDFKWKFFLTRSYKASVCRLLNYIASTDDQDCIHFKALLNGSDNVQAVGDTKYERISKAKSLAETRTLINGKVLTNKDVFVIGSSWDKDEEILFPVIDKINSNGHIKEQALMTIIAPHEPTEDTLEEIEYEIQTKYSHLKMIRYSSLNKYKDENIILIDCIGILMTLYKYADLAYVGGGFQTGMHNVLEPAGYGIPVLFGDQKLSEDAENLISKGGGIAVDDQKSLYKNLLHLLKDDEARLNIGIKSFSVFDSKNEASKKIAKILNKRILNI